MKFGISTKSLKGNKYNGDMYFIKEYDNKVFVSLIDGIGHGEHAAIASEKCIQCIEERYKRDVIETLIICNNFIKKTNGVVIGIMLIDFLNSTLSYIGVGNISARIINEKTIHLVSKEGIVGYRLPKLKEYKYPYHEGYSIIMHSDGISSKSIEYPISKIKNQDVQQTANEIMKLFGKDIDDATIIVAR